MIIQSLKRYIVVLTILMVFMLPTHAMKKNIEYSKENSKDSYNSDTKISDDNLDSACEQYQELFFQQNYEDISKEFNKLTNLNTEDKEPNILSCFAHCLNKALKEDDFEEYSRLKKIMHTFDKQIEALKRTIAEKKKKDRSGFFTIILSSARDEIPAFYQSIIYSPLANYLIDISLHPDKIENNKIFKDLISNSRTNLTLALNLILTDSSSMITQLDYQGMNSHKIGKKVFKYIIDTHYGNVYYHFLILSSITRNNAEVLKMLTEQYKHGIDFKSDTEILTAVLKSKNPNIYSAYFNTENINMKTEDGRTALLSVIGLKNTNINLKNSLFNILITKGAHIDQTYQSKNTNEPKSLLWWSLNYGMQEKNYDIFFTLLYLSLGKQNYLIGKSKTQEKQDASQNKEYYDEMKNYYANIDELKKLGIGDFVNSNHLPDYIRELLTRKISFQKMLEIHCSQTNQDVKKFALKLNNLRNDWMNSRGQISKFKEFETSEYYDINLEYEQKPQKKFWF